MKIKDEIQDEKNKKQTNKKNPAKYILKKKKKKKKKKIKIKSKNSYVVFGFMRISSRLDWYELKSVWNSL